MQDEVNEKVVALSIKTSKLTAEVLQKAMKAVLAKGKQQLSKAPHGKITMRQLMKPGEKVTNIEITDANIKSFDPSFLYSRCARIAKLMGYQKIITYTLATENGASLRASGWQCAPGLRGGGNWNVPGRPRADSRNTGPKRLYYRCEAHHAFGIHEGDENPVHRPGIRI